MIVAEKVGWDVIKTIAENFNPGKSLTTGTHLSCLSSFLSPPIPFNQVQQLIITMGILES